MMRVGVRSIRARLESPRFALGSTLAVVSGIVIAYVVPQRWTGVAPSGVWSDDRVARIVSALWLDRVYASPWFLAILLVFLVAMTSSVVRQVGVARRRLRSGLPGPWIGVGYVSNPEEFAAFASGHGYMLRRDATSAVRHPYGHFAAILLHAGIILAVLFAVLVTVTQQRMTISLAAGETWMPGSPVAEEAHGPLVRALVLDAPVTLAEFTPRFWESGGVRSLESTVRFADSLPFTVSVKNSAYRDGLRFYQSQLYGDAFFVEVAAADEATQTLRLDLSAPPAADVASYADFSFGSQTRVLRAKYYLDESHESMIGTPTITLRLVDDGEVIDEVSLTEGTSTAFDGGTIQLVAVRRWTDVIIVADHGVPLLFLSFAVLLAGALLVYLAPVRELRVIPDGDRFEVQWTGVRGHGIDSGEAAALRAELEPHNG